MGYSAQQDTIENTTVCWLDWKDLAQELDSQYNGTSVRIVENPANNFFFPPLSKSDIGRCGKLRARMCLSFKFRCVALWV
jgi:hypothetical protein